MIVEFGRWQLRPCDNLNWQLWERRKPMKNKSTVIEDGEEGWYPCGRYYSYSTFPNAVEYAIDCMLRERDDGVYGLAGYLREYKALLGRFEKQLYAALALPHSPANG